jgi:hypothetical protein
MERPDWIVFGSPLASISQRRAFDLQAPKGIENFWVLDQPLPSGSLPGHHIDESQLSLLINTSLKNRKNIKTIFLINLIKKLNDYI